MKSEKINIDDMALDIHIRLIEIDSIINEGVFDRTSSPLFKGSYIHLLILLRDVIFKFWKLGKEINFTEDVDLDDKITNISLLIKHMRDAVCHPDSTHNLIEDCEAPFVVFVGKNGSSQLNDFIYNSPYADDICIYQGKKRIFYKRNILRTIETAKALAKDVFKDSKYAWRFNSF